MQTQEPQRLLRDTGGPLVQPRAAEIHLRDRLSVFYRYRYVAALAFLVVVAGAAVWTGLRYRARGSVERLNGLALSP